MKRIFGSQTFYLFLATAVLGTNLVTLTQELTQLHRARRERPFIFLGFKFSGLDDILEDVQYMGYYTDKDLDETAPALQFAQAQYVVAPVILDLNNTEHPYVLFDCADPDRAWKKMHEIGAIPVRKNQFGVILARNPRRGRP